MPRSRFESLVDHQVDGLRAGMLDVCPGCIEVIVARDDLARPADQLEQDALAGTPLMRRQDMRHPGQFEEHRFGTDTSFALRRTTHPHAAFPPTARRSSPPVPLSVKRSMSTSSAGIRNGLKWAERMIASRSCGVVSRIGSTILILNGSIIVFIF